MADKECEHSVDQKVEAHIGGLCPLCLQADVERLKALCLRESGVLKEALRRKHNKSMIAVVAGSLEEQALKGG